MNLKPLASNMTELEINGSVILFSYRTPVAVLHSDGMAYRTEKKWSNTTSRHINKWMSEHVLFGAQFKPQEFFDRLIAEAK